MACKGRKQKLTDEDIASIQQWIVASEQKAKIAKEFGINRETLYMYFTSVVLPKESGF